MGGGPFSGASAMVVSGGAQHRPGRRTSFVSARWRWRWRRRVRKLPRRPQRPQAVLGGAGRSGNAAQGPATAEAAVVVVAVRRR